MRQAKIALGWVVALACFVPAAIAQDFDVVRVGSDFERPVYATTPPGETARLFVLEQQTGRVRILDPADGSVQALPFLEIPVQTSGNEQGLLGLAFHPSYAENGWLFVNYTRRPDGATVISRWRVSAEDPNQVDPGSERVLLTQAQPFSNHNGGWLGFGPDGYLYAAMGDGGGPPLNRAQDLGTLYGTVLRLDVDVDEPPYYKAPVDNPFAEEASAALTWAYGLRNPWRCSFDRATGDFYIADVGQDAWEEINFQPAGHGGGRNYGWQVFEGEDCYRDDPSCGSGGFTEPLYAYPHDESSVGGESVTGGYVYRGPASSLRGLYLFADFISGRVWGLRHDGAAVVEFRDLTDAFQPNAGTLRFISSFAEDGAGNVYLLDLGGDVFKIQSNQAAAVDLVGPTNGEAGQRLAFQAVSSDESNPVDSVLWDMGDGVELATVGGAVEYAYKAPGTYTVTANAALSAGGSAVGQITVAVADFSPDEPLGELFVQFEGDDRAILQWHGGNDAAVDLARYDVYMQRGAEAFQYVTGVRRTFYRVDNLSPGAAYTFNVQAVYEGEISGETVSAVVMAPSGDGDEKPFHLRFPHVVDNDQWWTGIVIVNPNEEAAETSLRVLGQMGNVITDQGALTQLGPGEKSVGLGYQYYDQDIFIPNVWFDLASSRPLIAFELFGQEFGVMSGLEVSGRLQRRGFLPAAKADAERYAGISLVNASEGQTCNLILKGFDGDGALLAQAEARIPPLGKLLNVAQDLFGELWREDIETILWEADQPVTGFQIWGDLQWSQQNGMLTAHSGALRNILPVIEPGGAIVLQNTAPVENRVTLIANQNDGVTRDKKNYVLPPYGRLSLPADVAVTPDFAGSAVIESSATLNALFELRRIRRGRENFTEAIPAQSATGAEFVYPHVASGDQWTTEIMLVNAGDEAADAVFEAYDGQGRFLERVTRSVPAFGRIHLKARELFENAAAIAYLRVAAGQPTFVGHLIYYTNEGWGSVMGGAPTPPL